jgi:hypothetical protein
VVAAAHRTDTTALEHFPAWSPTGEDPFDGLVEGWRATVAAAGAASVEMRRNDCPGGVEAPTWSLRVDVSEGADPATLVAVGRLLERADILADAARLGSHRHDEIGPTPGSRPLARICWQDR